jgi:16S rRNA (guanine527-N7)-methyltransferase
MPAQLPAIDRELFARRLADSGVPELDGGALERLSIFYEELRRWARRVSLIGPGAAEEVIERHFAESLRPLALLGRGRLLDVGSGAGFPGLALAAAVPDLDVVLVERRERKVAFLRAVARRAGVAVEVLEGDLSKTLPALEGPRVDFVTLRAIRLDDRGWNAVLGCAVEGARVLVWCGRDEPVLPAALHREEVVALPGDHRRIVCSRYQP